MLQTELLKLLKLNNKAKYKYTNSNKNDKSLLLLKLLKLNYASNWITKITKTEK